MVMNSIGSAGKMKLFNCGHLLKDPARKRQCFCNLMLAATLLCIVFFMGSAFVTLVYEEKLSTWGAANSAQTNQTNSKTKLNLQNTPSNSCKDASTRGAVRPVRTNQKKSKTKLNLQNTQSNLCESQRKPAGSEPLPKGIISQTSNFEMQPLGGSTERKGKSKSSKSLLAIPVGIKQKEIVNQIVKQFPLSDFTVMLFHYDGVVDEWRDLQWSYSALHISAINQTKWWFAKRFLHPDIVAEYNYIFLWDEDLGVTNFHPLRYLSIIKREGLEISQPALDASKSGVHHRITARWRKGDVHRRIYKLNSGGRCYENSSSPPCTGWVEMMAPVFSRAAWRCAWHMIQNDLIHAWGLDMKLGYCAQGDRSKNVGVVDSEYIVHKGIPTLGGFDEDKVHPGPRTLNDRFVVRKRSYIELEIFGKRWQRAVTEDKCWIDPYPKSLTNSSH